MTTVTATIDIDRPVDDVWAVVVDPRRFGEWVTIHRRLGRVDAGEPRVGFKIEQTLALGGAPFKVAWTLTEYQPPEVLEWEGRGPARSYARTEYTLSARDGGGGTRFDYENEYKTPGGPLGALAGRVVGHHIAERETNRSLQRLKTLLER